MYSNVLLFHIPRFLVKENIADLPEEVLKAKCSCLCLAPIGYKERCITQTLWLIPVFVKLGYLD